MTDILSAADLSTVDRVLATARSVRRRLDFDRELAPEVLLECIDLATQAPTGAAGESWRFVIACEPELKHEIARLYREVLEEFASARGVVIKPTQRALVDRLHEIPAMVLVCASNPPPAEVPAQVAYYGSVLPAAWSLMLALRARHIGATWTTLLSARQEALKKLLSMPSESLHLVMLPVGYMKDATLRKAPRLDARTVTYWDRWGEELAADTRSPRES